MSIYRRNASIWHTFPLVGSFILKWRDWRISERQLHYRLAPLPQAAGELAPYPIDMWPLLALPFGTLDEEGIPYNDAPIGEYLAAYNTTTIAQYALAHWNAYVATGDEQHKQIFMMQARWLVAHASPLENEQSGWPIPFPLHKYNAEVPWLSALTQGNCISVLVRAYQLTHEEVFLHIAQRAVRTFERDIQDGGVSATVGDNGIFFEEVAVYPAAHILNGYILALFGLYDYVALTADVTISELIQRSLITLHTFIDKFDTGYWSCYDVRFRHLSPRFYHALHITLLEALARYSGCEHCTLLAAHWTRYQQSFTCRSWYFMNSLASHCFHALYEAFSRLKDKK